VLCQEAVGVRQSPSDFQADPRGQSDLLMFAAELDFRYGKTEVLAREDIDFPREIATRKLITPLLDDA
jgi:hypothetical protein